MIGLFIAFVTCIYIYKIQHKDVQRPPSHTAAPLLRTEVPKPDITLRGREFSKRGIRKNSFITVNRREDHSDSISVRKVQTHSHTHTHTHIYASNGNALSLYNRQDCGMCP
jgi:hypothetical protein